MVRKALRILFFPVRAVWFLILLVNFLVVSAACLLVAAFVGYAIALTISYAFLPTEWTQALWQWAAELYDQSPWFKAATIAAFVLLLLPILALWPGKDPRDDAARKREIDMINDHLAARQQRERLR